MYVLKISEKQIFPMKKMTLYSPSGFMKKWFLSNGTFAVYSFVISLFLKLEKLGYFIPHDKWHFWGKSFFHEPWGEVQGHFFIGKFVSQKSLKHTWIDSIFNADSEYDIGFDLICCFVTEKGLNREQKCIKLCFTRNVFRYGSDDQEL